MPATYARVSRLTPSGQRTGVITDIDASDEIDIVDVLGRSARRIKIVPSGGDSVEIELRINNRIKIPVPTQKLGEALMDHHSPGSVIVVSKGEEHALYELTGSDQYYTEEGVTVAFVQIESVSAGTLTIYCW